MKAYKSVGEYAEGLLGETRAEFESAWQAICASVSDCEEAIRYGMPMIRFRGRNLVHLAVMKNHFGFYPTASGVHAFESEIRDQKRG